MPQGSLTTTAVPTQDDLSSSPALRAGVAGALALHVGLVLVWIIGIPLFGPADERAHVDYAWQVAHGSLPVAGTPFTAEFPELGQVGYFQHVSNHPPLYYAVAGPVLRVADAVGHPATGLYLLRFLNAGLTLVTILAIAKLATIVTARARRPLRIGAVIAACTLAAVNPALLATSGSIQNDALAVLLATLLVTLLAQAARTGVDRRVVGQVAVLCTLGMLTRVTFLTVVLLAVAAVVTLTLWPELRRRRPSRDACEAAVLRAAAIGGTVAVGAGWFLVLNWHRYGDLTGGSAVYGMKSVQDRTLAPGAGHGPLVYLLHPGSWWVQLKQLAAPVPSIASGHAQYDVLSVALLLVLAAGVVALVRRQSAVLLDRQGALTLGLLALVLLTSMAKLAVHVTHRGGPNLRYLLDGIGFWAVGGALVVLALGRFATPALAVLALIGARACLGYTTGIIGRTDDLSTGSTLHAVRESLHASVVPGAEVAVVLALLLAAGGLIQIVRASTHAATERTSA